MTKKHFEALAEFAGHYMAVCENYAQELTDEQKSWLLVGLTNVCDMSNKDFNGVKFDQAVAKAYKAYIKL